MPLADQMDAPAEDGWRKCVVNLPIHTRLALRLCFCVGDAIKCRYCKQIDDYAEKLASYIEERMA